MTTWEATPDNFASLLSSPPIQPLDTVLMHEGTYTGDFISALTGTPDAPIAVRPYPHEHPVIDGSLTINGAYSYWYNLHVYLSTWTTRTSAYTDGHDLPGIHNGIDIMGPGVKVINCVVHDQLQGICPWMGQTNGEVYGCIVFNNGFVGTDRSHGHGMYIQNESGIKPIRDCIALPQFEYGFHAYGSSAAKLDYLNFERCVSLDNWLVGGKSPIHNLYITDSVQWGTKIQLGYGTSCTNHDYSLLDTILLNGAKIQVDGTWEQELQSWETVKPDNRVFVYPNKYEPERANVVIINSALAPEVAVDLSDVPLQIGGQYVLKNAENYLLEGFPFTYSGCPVIVPMTGWTVAKPIGHTRTLYTLDQSTYPAFGVFVLEAA